MGDFVREKIYLIWVILGFSPNDRLVSNPKQKASCKISYACTEKSLLWTQYEGCHLRSCGRSKKKVLFHYTFYDLPLSVTPGRRIDARRYILRSIQMQKMFHQPFGY